MATCRLNLLMTAFDISQLDLRPAHRDDVSELAEFIKPFVAEGRLLPRTIDEIEEFLRRAANGRKEF